MKNTYKIALVLFSTIALVACFCKKEKCPDTPDYIKYAMPYKGGEEILFQNYDYQENRLDTVKVTVNKTEHSSNISCSNPNSNLAGNCQTFYRLSFDYRFLNENSQIYRNSIKPRWVYQYSNSQKVFKLNYKFSLSKDEIKINGKLFKNVKIDSLNNTDDYNKENCNVLYYTQNDGLILAKKYENDTLKIEMRKI